MQPNEPEITNHKPVTDKSVILNAVNALLTSAGFYKDVDDAELLKRKIFTEFIMIIANVGFRSKELLVILQHL